MPTIGAKAIEINPFVNSEVFFSKREYIFIGLNFDESINGTIMLINVVIAPTIMNPIVSPLLGKLSSFGKKSSGSIKLLAKQYRIAKNVNIAMIIVLFR